MTARWPLILAVAGAVACAAGLLVVPVALAHAWLAAGLMALGLPLGAIVISLIHALSSGRWGEDIAPQTKLLAGLMPVAVLLFLPLLAFIPVLLPFLTAMPQTLAPEVAAKLGYLDPPWMIGRTLIVFAVWIWLSFVVSRPGRPSRPVATIGLAGYALTLTLFATDWMQALEPEFVSTIYPMLVGGVQLLGAFALITAMRLSAPADERSSGDLAKLLLSAALTWGYLGFMQYLIIWIGDLPTEITYFIRRDGFWAIGGYLMTALLLVVPFLALIVASVRSDGGKVRLVALAVVAGYVTDGLWRILPAFGGSPIDLLLSFAALAVFASAGIGFASWRGSRRPEARHA